MELPKISIVTPSYNQGQYIEQTINSVLDQNYPILEYIIIDGGSKDETLDIIQKYSKQLSYWVSEKDNGQSDAINKGFKMATGDIINWLNSDDYYEPNALHHVSNKLINPNINCYIGKSRIFNKQTFRFSEGTDIYLGNLFKTIGWARIDQPETFFQRSVFEKIGFINESLHFVMDKDIWIRYLSKFGLDGIEKDSQLLVHFRLHESSKTISMGKNFEEETKSLFYTYAAYFKLEHFCKIFEELWDVRKLELKYYPFALKSGDWDRILNYFILQQGLQEYACNNYKKSKQILSFVAVNWLQKEDKDELKKVQLRIKYLPKTLKMIINKFNNNTHLFI